LKEAGKINEVVALTIGDKGALETLRAALAMGADKGIHVKTDMQTDTELQPLAVAKVFKHFMDRDEYKLTILGKQSIDDDSNQTGQILAAMMNIP